MKKLVLIVYTLFILAIGAGLGVWGYDRAQAETFWCQASSGGVVADMMFEREGQFNVTLTGAKLTRAVLFGINSVAIVYEKK
jgi:hypothetical protein